jgi:hypothetical protein
MARKRQRDYAAEYARRIASGALRGKTRQAARGHKVREHVERAAREARKFGIAGSRLTRLRAEALHHVLHELNSIRTKYKPNEETIRRGLNLLHSETLRLILTQSGNDYRMMAMLDYQEVAQVISEDPATWGERNPYWYGPG